MSDRNTQIIGQLAKHVDALDKRGATIVYDPMLLELLLKLGFVKDSEYLEGWIVIKPKPLSH